MPQLRFRGVLPDHVKEASRLLPKTLARICETTEDNFIFECVKSRFYAAGAEQPLTYPLVEVLMFDRGDEVAQALFDCFKVFLEERGYHDPELYIIPLATERYFY